MSSKLKQRLSSIGSQLDFSDAPDVHARDVCTRGVSRALKIAVNEPSVGLCMVQNHVRGRGVPALERQKTELLHQVVLLRQREVEGKEVMEKNDKFAERGSEIVESLEKTLKSCIHRLEEATEVAKKNEKERKKKKSVAKLGALGK